MPCGHRGPFRLIDQHRIISDGAFKPLYGFKTELGVCGNCFDLVARDVAADLFAVVTTVKENRHSDYGGDSLPAK